jgi:NTP pyrophosphatase (non-canonical NTP hydrolase)
MLHLEPHPDLAALQTYVRQLEEERGFTNSPVQQECLLLGEEVGELFKAVRKREKLQIDANSKVGSVEEELADVLIYICAIANRFEIDLEKALRDKEEINKKRVWRAG